MEKINKISKETKVKASFTLVILKLLEIGALFGLTFGIYYLGKFADKMDFGISNAPTWINGLFLFITILFGAALLIVLSYLVILFLIWFVKLNWKWALILNETPEEKKIRENNKTAKQLKKVEEKKVDYIKQNGFWIGDRVKIIKSNTDSENKYLNKIGKVKQVGNIFSCVKIEDMDDVSFYENQLKPVKDRRKNDKSK